MITDAALALLSWLLCIAFLAITLLGVAKWNATNERADEERAQREAARFAAESNAWAALVAAPPDEILAVDPPVVPAYLIIPAPVVPDGWTMFRGGLVHIPCLKLWLRGGQLVDGCKVHLRDDVQAGTT